MKKLDLIFLILLLLFGIAYATSAAVITTSNDPERAAVGNDLRATLSMS